MGDDFFEGLNEVKERLRPELAVKKPVGDSKWRVLYEISTLLSSSARNYAEVIETILDATISLTKADRGFMMLYNHRDKLEVKSARNMNFEALDEDDRRISNSVVEAVLERGEAICVSNMDDDKRFSDMSSIIRLKILSVMCVPLKISYTLSKLPMSEMRVVPQASNQKIIGVIYVDSQSISHQYTETDLEFFQALANNLTIALVNARLYQQATTDDLTGLYSRRYFSQRLKEEIRQSQKTRVPMIVGLLDVDRLKRINLVHGYHAGDTVLKQIGKIMGRCLRGIDVCARYGGDEFALILPQTDSSGGEEAARKIVHAVRDAEWVHGQELLTVSLGMATLIPGDTEAKLVKRADQALYQAKVEGADRYRLWSPDLADRAKRTDKLAGVFCGDTATDYRNVLTLIETTARINAVRDLGILLSQVLDAMIEITRAERGILFMLEGGKLAVRVARDRFKNNIEAEDYSQSVVEQVLETLNPICVEDTAGGKDMSRSIEQLEIRAVMCVPLALGEQVLGAVYVDTRASRDRFDESSLAFFDSLAQQCAFAVTNARLLKEVQAQSEEITNLNIQLEKRLEKTQEEVIDLMGELDRQRAETQLKYNYDNIIGRSSPMQKIFKLIDRITPTNVPVFIHGESGTGKELVAKAIHYNGPRRKKKMISENCAAVAESLLESELFGYVRGAFTGADRDRKGVFEMADGGSLFLDEVGEMSLGMQKKLLRVLQENEVRRVGGKETISVDARIISASNKNLMELIDTGDFRQDLFYRLNVVQVNLPPLRDRKEDIPLLVDHFLGEGLAPDEARMRLTADAVEALMRYNWPGNIRELKNVVDRARIMADGNVITRDALMFDGHLGPSEPAPMTSSAPALMPSSPRFGDNLPFDLNDRQKRLVEYLRDAGSIRNREYYEQMKVSKSTGWRDLTELIKRDIVICHGKGKGSIYTLHEDFARKLG